LSSDLPAVRRRSELRQHQNQGHHQGSASWSYLSIVFGQFLTVPPNQTRRSASSTKLGVVIKVGSYSPITFRREVHLCQLGPHPPKKNIGTWSPLPSCQQTSPAWSTAATCVPRRQYHEGRAQQQPISTSTGPPSSATRVSTSLRVTSEHGAATGIKLAARQRSAAEGAPKRHPATPLPGVRFFVVFPTAHWLRSEKKSLVPRHVHKW
jgi:hypothetical protein